MHSALSSLVSGLRGELAPNVDWVATIELANQCWVTPALRESLSATGALREVPDDVGAYLNFLHARNAERNHRLRRQFIEAVTVLNAHGIVPVTLKGSSTLAAEKPSARMLSDIDLVVPWDAIPNALVALDELGYRELVRHALKRRHAYAVLARPQDVGTLDLHHQAPGFTSHLEPQVAPSSLVYIDGSRVEVPLPSFQALHLIVHDQLHDGDYWTGCIDVRHVFDLHQLDRQHVIDWELIATVMGAGPARRALATQLVTLHELFGSNIPAKLRSSYQARIQFHRRLLQAGYPRLTAPLRSAGTVTYALRRIAVGDAPDWWGVAPLRTQAGILWRRALQGPAAVLDAVTSGSRPKL